MLTCKRTGEAKDCTSCKHSAWNQQGKPSGQPINPSVKKDGRCAAYVGVPYAVTPGDKR